VPFGPLKEFEIVLHTAFHKLFNGHGPIDLMAGENVWK
jgi:hypothetical protein